MAKAIISHSWNDIDISEDWIDHILIERARNELGKDVSLDELLASHEQGSRTWMPKVVLRPAAQRDL